MDRTVEIVYSNSMKINRGNYEQEAPFYSAKSVITLPSGADVESACNSEYERLKGIVEPLLVADYNAKRTDLANIRIREKDGKKYPSVTSILNPDGMSKKIKNLEQYAARGDEYDRLFKGVMTKGVLGELDNSKFKDLPEVWDVIEFIKSHKLLKKSDVTNGVWKQDVEIFNEKWMYSGEIDLFNGTSCIMDVKTGAWKWEQQVAYAETVPGVNDVMIADLKNNETSLISRGSQEWEDAWLYFIYMRGQFKARFGI